MDLFRRYGISLSSSLGRVGVRSLLTSIYEIMKESKIILLVFLACFSISIPIEVSGQSMVIIGRDSFEMYPNPLQAEQVLHDKVYKRIPEGDYIRDIPPYMAWWRLQNDSLFLERIEDCYSTIRSDDHKTVFMDIEGIFDAYLQDGKIFASWYSGELDIAGGECIYQAAMGFRSDYEDQRIYRVENGRVVTEKRYRNIHKKAELSSDDYASSLIATLFNGDRFPELADKYLQTEIQGVPTPEGSLDSVEISVRVVDDRNSYGKDWDDDSERLTDDSFNPYIQELKQCLELVPGWDYLLSRGRVRPSKIWLQNLWEGKGCKAVYPDDPRCRDLTDTLFTNGKACKLKNYPLQYDMNLYARMRSLLRDEFIPLCLRGYTACWEIRDGKLYLISIRGAKSGQAFPLDVVFPGNNGSPVEATWYTGKLHLSSGDKLGQEYPLREICREESFYEVKEGKIVNQTSFNNFYREGDKESYTRCEEEIIDFDWDQFPELKGKMPSCRFTVWPRENGVADSIQITLRVHRREDTPRREEGITDPAHPYMAVYRKALASVTRWDVLSVRGQVQPFEYFIINRRCFSGLKTKECVLENFDVTDGGLHRICVKPKNYEQTLRALKGKITEHLGLLPNDEGGKWGEEWNKWQQEIANKCIPAATRNTIQARIDSSGTVVPPEFWAFLLIDREGNIQNVYFTLSESIYLSLTETQLQEIYNLLMNEKRVSIARGIDFSILTEEGKQKIADAVYYNEQVDMDTPEMRELAEYGLICFPVGERAR